MGDEERIFVRSLPAFYAWIKVGSYLQIYINGTIKFDGAGAPTDGAGNNIPSSAFKVSDNGGASTALTNTVAFGAATAGLQLGASTAITGANKTGSRSDAMTFNIDLTGGTLPQLPAATYTGTLNIQAQATP